MLIVENNEEMSSYLPKKYRYIRCHINWNSINSSNHFLELEAYYNWTNVARWKTVTIVAWSMYPSSPRQPVAFTDGDKNTNNYVDLAWNTSTWGTLQVDLWSAYELSHLILRHYFGDTRYYKDNIVTASKDWTKRDTLFNSNVSWTYNESSSWKRINIQ